MNLVARRRVKEIKNNNILITKLDPKSPAVEAFKLLRTNITYASADEPIQVIGFTSSGPTEGKSSIASNLAVAMALSGNNVLIIDSDLRRPSLHKIFGLHRRPAGLTEILTGTKTIDDCIVDTEVENLKLLPAGAIPPNPSELLGSKKMKELHEQLREKYDIIIYDLPPVISVTDPLVVSPLIDGYLLVVASGSTDRRAAVAAKELLLNAKANILGVVLNRADPQKSYGSYYTHYYYYYHDDE